LPDNDPAPLGAVFTVAPAVLEGAL
jgi:hypothetical protein